jgi:hypothetical protein
MIKDFLLGFFAGISLLIGLWLMNHPAIPFIYQFF